jgi:murein L,D-transpeptidase YcbB/YkuD
MLLQDRKAPICVQIGTRISRHVPLRSLRVSWLLVVLAFIIHEAGCSRPPQSDLQDSLRRVAVTKDIPRFVLRGEAETLPWKETQGFYRKRNFQPAWLSDSWLGGRRVNAQATKLLTCLRDARQEGLDPAEYPIDELEQQISRAGHSASSQELAWLDAKLTYTFFEYAAHLYRGRLNPKRLNPTWQVTARKRDWAPLLEEALDQRNICGVLTKLTPALPEYAALRKVLDAYSRIAEAGGWPKVPDSHPLKKGDRGASVSLLRKSLEQQGDLVSRAPDGNQLFDEDLASGVRAFEERNGLPMDGVADVEMLSVLNTPVETLMWQIELNMERLRWLPDDLGRRYLLVNIPDYRLQLVENGQTILQMRVVVGKKENPTPVFSDQMTYLTFNPFWNIPENIAIKETIPLLRKDDDYAEKHGIQVVMKGNNDEIVNVSKISWRDVSQEGKAFPYLLRQRPGPGNALGRVKFMFPNQFNVYLHDTPTRHLFKTTERDYSHGCVRVEHPVELAEYLLKDKPGWDADRIHNQMEAEDEISVTLVKSLPVHIVYWSVWVGENGKLQRRPDIYELDSMQEELFAKRALKQFSMR